MPYDKGFDCGLWTLNRLNIMIILCQTWNGLPYELVSFLSFEAFG